MASTRSAKPDPKTMCRGKWSVCGGKYPQKSESWHICDSCTEKRAKATKAGGKAPISKPAARTTRTKQETAEVAAS